MNYHLPCSLLATLCVLAPLVGCDQSADAALGEEPAASSPRTTLRFDGYVVPMNATELRAPQNTFRVGGWNSNSSWTKLIHLVEDGTEVAEGDLVAKFEFDGERAKPYVEKEIRQAEASRDQSGVEKERQVDELSSEEKKKQIDAESAELDTRRRGVIAERDWELARITHRQAEFDAQATSKHRQAVQAELRAESEYHSRNVDRAHSLQKRFDTYQERFQVVAGHAGVVRHAYSRRRGRKVQKGDGMPAGSHFASIAKDKDVSVQFFVPERHWRSLEDADRFVVESATSKSSWDATVDRVEEFPQELGFLKNDNGLPNAREKAYVVWATFDEQPEGLSAGVEVRVRKR